MKEGFSVSNHTFINLIMKGLEKKLTKASDKINIIPANKEKRGDTIKLELLSQHISENSEDLNDTKSAVDTIMQNLKNEVNLISLLGK